MASGAIRVVLTTSGIGWHHVQEYPSGVYISEDYGWNPLENFVTGAGGRSIPLVSGYILGDITLNHFSPSDITIVDARRPGGHITDEARQYQDESPMYLDSEETLL